MILFTLLTIIAIVISILFIQYVQQTKRLYRAITKLPGPPYKNFLIGNISALQDTQENIFKIGHTYGKKYFPIYHTCIMHLAQINICSPEDCELVMTNMKHIEKSQIYTVVKEWLKNGLLTSTGAHWQHRRKILTPAFHFTILQQFVSIFNDDTAQLIDTLRAESHLPYIEINKHITQLTLKSIAETSMGTKLNFQQQEVIDYKRSIIEFGEVAVYRLMHTWLIYWPIFIFSKLFYKQRKLLNVLHSFTRNIIELHFNGERINFDDLENDVNAKNRRLCMLDLLFTAKQDKQIDDQGIHEEVDTFLFEGHDTTSVAICYVLMTLACNPQSQKLILQEMEEVLNGDVHKLPTFKDLQEMKYLERCLKEVLRLYPSVPFISRYLGEDVISSSGYLLPKGAVTHMHIYDIHHNASIYPDPEKFDPDRFLPDAIANRHPFAYIPFSAGPRNCIGQRYALLELKSVVCGVLANFELEAVDTPETITFIADLVLRTKDDIKVKFVQRNL